MSLVARAPTRIDLAGGTIDLWPIYLLVEHGATVNIAIDLVSEVAVADSPDELWHVRERDSGRCVSAASAEALSTMPGGEIAGHLLSYFAPPRPLRLTTHTQAPPQAGLGGSSSLGISIAGALNGLTGFRLDALALVSLVKDVEVELLRAMTGAQDHYPPVFGGACCLWWGKLAHRREPLTIDTEAFCERFVLAYSHQPHRSGATNWEVVKRFLEGDPDTVDAVERSGHNAVRIRDAIVDGDLNRVATLIDEDWQARKDMAPAVTSPELDELIAAAREGGATAARVCGAGGGGCILIATPDDGRPAVESAIREAGGSVLDYGIASNGLELVTDG